MNQRAVDYSSGFRGTKLIQSKRRGWSAAAAAVFDSDYLCDSVSPRVHSSVV